MILMFFKGCLIPIGGAKFEAKRPRAESLVMVIDPKTLTPRSLNWGSLTPLS